MSRETRNEAASSHSTAGAPSVASTTPPIAGPTKYVSRVSVWSTALAPATRRTSSPSSPLTIALCDPSDAAHGTPERNASATRSGNDSAPSRCSSGIAAVVTTHTASQATSARHGP